MTHTISDITDQFEDVNAYDRIYRSSGGFTVKVRVEDVSPSPSVMAFKVTGSWADETGHARQFGEGHFIVEPHEVCVRSDTIADVGDLVQEGRLLMVGRVEQAAIHFAARQALTGIKPKALTGPVDPMESSSSTLP